MSETSGPRTGRGRAAGWLLWGGFAVLWTAALLTTFPVEARDAVLPEQYGFSAGKALHVAAYAVFAVLTGRLDVPSPWRWALLGFLSLHAAGTECLQRLVDRTPSWADVGLDHLGIALGVALTWRRWLALPRP